MTLLSSKVLQLTSVVGKSDLTELINLASDSNALMSSGNRELNRKFSMKRHENIKSCLCLNPVKFQSLVTSVETF